MRTQPAPPIKKKNGTRPTYLSSGQIRELKAAARKTGRNGFRDELVVTMLYRHAFRVTELVNLRWDRLDLEAGKIHVERAKGSSDSVHYLEADEIRALNKLKKESRSDFVFCSERGGPMTERTAFGIVQRAGKIAGIPFKVHPHQLRHSKGTQLAMKGADTRAIQDYLGHKNIMHTVRYTKLSSERFKGFGKD